MPRRKSRTPRAGKAPRVGKVRENVSAPGPADTGGRLAYVAACACGLATGVAWWFPDTAASALLGWCAAGLLVYAVRARRAYLPSYCAGLVCCALGFYWIYATVNAFGGLPAAVSALVFALFVAGSATQFLVFAFVHNNLGPRFDALALRSPVALVVSELVSLRLFFWHYGHTQVAFTPMVQIAAVGGAMAVSFLMFWLAEAAVRFAAFGERRRAFFLPVLAVAASLAYGAACVRAFEAPGGAPLDVVLVQANGDVNDMLDSDLVDRDVRRHHELSRSAPPGSLVIWPEGSVPVGVSETLGTADGEPMFPMSGDTAFLIGSYAHDAADRRYNAAFVVEPGGHVPRPYHKQILIPFGEAMPFATWFPWLNRLNPQAGVFTPGDETKVFDVPMVRPDGTTYRLPVAPLICYEDTVPSLARRATRMGARVLVNLTFDTWFGRTVAADEHHLIASFRAIENRRYLVRATNSGTSAVVDPLGRTVARAAPFTETAIAARIRLLTGQSAYTRFVGDTPWWALLALSAGAIAVRRIRDRRNRRIDTLVG